MDAALPAGPEHFRRDLETFRCAFLAARNDTENKGLTGVYSAFEALALCASRLVHEIDQEREKKGEAPLSLVAQELPDLMVEVPAWALVTFMIGWCRARFGEVADDGRKGHGLPLIEAFGLGSGGGRTVVTKHRNAHRDFKIATAIAVSLQQDKKMSEHQAIQNAMSHFKATETLVYHAWKTYEGPARDVALRYASAEFSESGQLKEEK
jgi:hypothetical protein